MAIPSFTRTPGQTPTMRKAYEDGKKVRFTKGKLYIDGREVSVA